MRSLAIMVLSLLCSHKVHSADNNPWAKMAPITPCGYVCQRVETAPKIDGHLDDASWQKAPWTADFLDIEGPTRRAPGFRTRAKMMWDEKYFYIAAELEEPHVWATLTAHDAVIFHDNDFEVFIDPNGDNHEYYELELNALNTTWDLFLTKPYKDSGDAKNSWEIQGLMNAVHVNGTLNQPGDVDKGWTLELALPWKALGEFAHRTVPPQDGDQWRVNFSRVQWQVVVENGKYQKVPNRREDNWVWSPTGIVDMHRPEKWGYVQFTKSSENNVQYVPDPAMKIRDELHALYYAQMAHHTQKRKFTSNLAELDFATSYATRIEASSKSFRATMTRTLPGPKSEEWHIREDGRIWTGNATAAR